MKYIVDGENLRQILWLLFQHRKKVWESTEGFRLLFLLEWLTASMRGAWITLIILGFLFGEFSLILAGSLVMLLQILTNTKTLKDREQILQKPIEYDEKHSS
jgi:hypothetical protein